MTVSEKRIFIDGNVMISKYLYGEPSSRIYHQIGYRGKDIIYRRVDELADNSYDNFHNNWDLLMNVICKIAKDNADSFSNEEILHNDIKNRMFQFAYDPCVTWEKCVEYVKLKLII